MLLVPLRKSVIPMMPFTAEELALLDGPTASPFVSLRTSGFEFVVYYEILMFTLLQTDYGVSWRNTLRYQSGTPYYGHYMCQEYGIKILIFFLLYHLFAVTKERFVFNPVRRKAYLSPCGTTGSFVNG